MEEYPRASKETEEGLCLEIKKGNFAWYELYHEKYTTSFEKGAVDIG